MIAVTSSKQWIHFLRSDRWPPTSKSLQHRGDHHHSSLATRELQHSGHSLSTHLGGSKHEAVGLSLLAWFSPPEPEEDWEERLQTGMWGSVGEPQQRAGSQRVCGGGDHKLSTFICSKYCLCVAFCLCALFSLLDGIMRVNVLR